MSKESVLFLMWFLGQFNIPTGADNFERMALGLIQARKELTDLLASFDDVSG